MTNALLGQRLRQQRKKRGLTIEQLAEMIGLSKNYVSLIERGRKLPSMATLIKIVNSLHISADVLLCDEVERRHFLLYLRLVRRCCGWFLLRSLCLCCPALSWPARPYVCCCAQRIVSSFAAPDCGCGRQRSLWLSRLWRTCLRACISFITRVYCSGVAFIG